MDVATGLPAFTNPFATPNVQQLIARQVEHNDGHCLLNTPLLLFSHFGINIGRWNYL
jgi:hypothetical protein